jgi:uncharacterized protein (DUF2147 family)
MKQYLIVIAAAISMNTTARSQTAEDFFGNWMTIDGEGIVKIERCGPMHGDGTTSNNMACAMVVWDKLAADTKRTKPHDCFQLVGRFRKFSNGVWEEGETFDPRTKKSYRGKIRLKNDQLNLRSYIGNELFGETEVFKRVQIVPNDCEATRIK